MPAVAVVVPEMGGGTRRRRRGPALARGHDPFLLSSQAAWDSFNIGFRRFFVNPQFCLMKKCIGYPSLTPLLSFRYNDISYRFETFKTEIDNP